MTIIEVYAPEEGFPGTTEELYDQLQNCLDSSNPNDYIVIAGDLNVRIGKTPVQNIMGPRGKPTINLYEKTLIDFASYNDLKLQIRSTDTKIYISILGVKEVVDLSLRKVKRARKVKKESSKYILDIEHDLWQIRKGIQSTERSKSIRKG